MGCFLWTAALIVVGVCLFSYDREKNDLKRNNFSLIWTPKKIDVDTSKSVHYCSEWFLDGFDPSTEINPCYEVILVLTSNNKSLPWFALIDFPSTNKKTQLNIEKQRNTVAFIMTHKTNQRKNSVSPVIEVLPLWCNLPLKINWTGDLLLISWFEYDHILYAICLCIRTLFDFMTCIFLAKTDNSDLHLGHQATILRKVKDTLVRVITGKGVLICEIIEYMSNCHFREWCFNELI